MLLEGLPARANAAFAIVVLVPFVWLSIAFWPFTVDDTYITLRYARHLAQGVGLTWNPGTAPAEGYTSFLWTTLLAPAHLLMSDAVAVAKGLGVIATLATVVVTMAIAREALALRRPWERTVASLVAGTIFTTDVATAVHAVSGMDTALFTTLLASTMLCATRVARRPTPNGFRLLSVLGLATGLTRPEGNLALFVIFALLDRNLEGENRRRLRRAVVLGYLAPAMLYFSWRIETYGLLFPLPFYVKAVDQPQLLAGLGEAWAFVWEFAVARPVVGIALSIGVLQAPTRLRPALAAALALFLFLLEPAPLMAYNHRYLYPLVPLLCACVGIGIVHLSGTITSWVSRLGSPAGIHPGTVAHDPRPLVVAVLVALVLGNAIAAMLQMLPGHLGEKGSYARGLTSAHVRLAHDLRKIPRTNRTIALLDVGAVGYHSGWNVLDTFGLNEPRIATEGRDDPYYVLGHAPDLVVVVSSNHATYDPVFPYEHKLFLASVGAGYKKVHALEFTPDYHLLVLAQDLSLARELF